MSPAMPKIELDASQEFSLLVAKVVTKFFACGPAMQESIRAMSAIVVDPETDDDDRASALDTISEALTVHERRHPASRPISRDDVAPDDPDALIVEAELDRRQATFADRLRATMESKRITQAQLADLVGVSQPAVSNLMTRQSWPQSRTVRRFAEALGVTPEELWPTTD